MTNQAKIKTVNATPVLKFKKDTVKNIVEAKENFDQNEIANKASSDFVRALGSPRGALVSINTMFQAIAVTRGTQPIVNAINKANAKDSTKEVSLLKWVTGQVFEGAKIKNDPKTKKAISITIKGIKANKLILDNLNNVTVDKDNGGKTTINTKDLKSLITFDPKAEVIVPDITLEAKTKTANNWIKAKAEAWNMTEAEVKIFLGTL
tara:strand:- start:9 stop:629 length:621 start_codon:yes stop_codon:yes gene_type:complete